MHEGDFLGVVAEREWDVIRAARQLEVTWSEVEPPFPEMDKLYTHIRRAPVVRESAGGGRSPDVAPDKASVEAALAAARMGCDVLMLTTNADTSGGGPGHRSGVRIPVPVPWVYGSRLRCM